NVIVSGIGFATGLLHQHAHRVAFVHQTQFAGFVRLAAVVGVHENTATGEDAVNLGHHRGNPAHIETLAQRAFFAAQQVAHVFLHFRQPETLVRHIDGELFGGGGNFYAFTLQVELTHTRVEGKHVRAITGAQHQQSGRAIQHITGGDLFAAMLQVGGFVGRIVAGVGLQNGKDGADGDVDVNVGRTVQRVKQHQEFTVRVTGHRV